MPLSEHEERLLAQMEAALSQEDPKLVSTLSQKSVKRSPLLSLALIGLGFATLLVGLIIQIVLVGVAGFIVALAGVYRLITTSRTSMKISRTPGAKGKSRFARKLEERWERRQFGEDQQ